MNTAKYVSDITVTDPDTNAPVEITVFKHENGGMFAVDASYIDSIATYADRGEIVNDPLSDNRKKVLLKWNNV